MVRIHTGSRAAASAAAIHARAYTADSHIVFAASEYQPGAQPGRELLTHELAHVAQQAGSPPVGPQPLPIVATDHSSEREADAIALQQRATPGNGKSATSAYPVIQRKTADGAAAEAERATSFAAEVARHEWQLAVRDLMEMDPGDREDELQALTPEARMQLRNAAIILDPSPANQVVHEIEAAETGTRDPVIGPPLPPAPVHPGPSVFNPGVSLITHGHQYVIYSDEVRRDGSVAWLGRNPGNIRNGDAYGAYSGKKVSAGRNGTFAVFPDEATGFEAIKAVLRGYGHVTIAQAMGRYAPAGDGGNDPAGYARTVAGRMGVQVGAFVDTLSESQLTTFALAIKQAEGWLEGTSYRLDDASLPTEVIKAIHDR
jgi:hypothetical protein